MKLKESIPSNSLKIIDLYNKIDSGLLDTSPDFQRKLVWKKQHKYAFIQTILLNYPFPEIYIASSEMDVQNLKALEIVVDGQQRLNAIVDYIKGSNDFKTQNKLVPFDELIIEDKKEFLNYSVTVKDMKDIGMDNIKEIFKRINSTDYSLNSNEVINAQFGDGEFSIFCKQLADSEYIISENETDIIILNADRELINSFLKKNNVFSDNDIKRMFDSQYLMLIVSTIMEGKYFGRSTRINHYLEKYNIEFSNYKNILDKIINSIELIKKMKFSEESYWFNKANLFSLIIELSNIKNVDLDLELFELKLIDLENKVDLYFNGDENDIKQLTNDETKYFEVARQGSHELSAREHRGKVIKEILLSSMFIKNVTKEENTLSKNINQLKSTNKTYATIIPTSTGLTKGIMDATSNVREFLKNNNLNDFEIQEFGPLKKIKKTGRFILEDSQSVDTEISMYRSNGRGDFRIWFTDLKTFAQPNDELILIVSNGILNVLNATKFDYSEFIGSLA
jgi:Protein of unknown function DUF262